MKSRSLDVDTLRAIVTLLVFRDGRVGRQRRDDSALGCFGIAFRRPSA